ncbi:hypothetical protein ID866_2818 [Astraeus odoratus]|nr:hypothetical protein ID866_2818 [Astraeus odoratus]
MARIQEIYDQISSPLISSLLTTHPNQVALEGCVPKLWSPWWDWAAEYDLSSPPKWQQLLSYYCRPNSSPHQPSTSQVPCQIPEELCWLIDTVRELQLSREPACISMPDRPQPGATHPTRGRSPSSFGMSPKKEHEVARMSSFIRVHLGRDARGQNVRHVVDVGSGQGYLSRALQAQGLHVLALDSSESQTTGANKWRMKDALRKTHEERRLNPQKDTGCGNSSADAPRTPTNPEPDDKASLTHRTVHIQPGSLEAAISDWLLTEFPDGSPFSRRPIPILLVALHACGSLTIDILRTFLSQRRKIEDEVLASPAWEPHSLVVVGCCYNLICPSDFPLSKSLLTLSPRPTLPIAALHLATQAPSHWFRTERAVKDTRLAVRKVVYRALLQPVLQTAAESKSRRFGSPDVSDEGNDAEKAAAAARLGLGETPENRRLGKLNDASYASWATFLSCATAKMGIDLHKLISEDGTGTNRQLPPWVLCHSGDKEEGVYERLRKESQLEVLHVLRCILGPLVESLILLDRYEWLHEEVGDTGQEKWDMTIEMVNLFDQATGSGRNVALVVGPASTSSGQ